MSLGRSERPTFGVTSEFRVVSTLGVILDLQKMFNFTLLEVIVPGDDV
jgi:hypothetical protein